MIRGSNWIFLLVVSILAIISSSANAGLGLYAGTGVPFQGQGGLTYLTGPSFMWEASYNKGNSLTGCRDFDLRTVLLGLDWYPFGEAFFIGAGGGHTTLYTSNVDPTTNTKFWMDAESAVAYQKMGWTWSKNDGGFWYGIDLSVYEALRPKKTIHASGVSTNLKEYRGIADAVTRFTGSYHLNITFLRLGWTF